MVGKVIDPGAQVAMYGGAGTAITVWGLQLSEWAAIVSAAVAVVGLIVHVWATIRKDGRAQELHRASLEELRANTKAIGSIPSQAEEND